MELEVFSFYRGVPNNEKTFFVRSDHAHAAIKSINTAGASQVPGVAAIFTGADIENAGLGGIPCGWQMTDKHGEAMKEPPHPILAQNKVRHVGDPIVGVIAETREEAEHAASLISITYEKLPSAVTMQAAIAKEAPLVHDDLGNNICYDWCLGEEADVDTAFAAADHVTTLKFINNRLVPNAMEPRAAIGDFNSAAGDYTLYTTSQNPHVIRLLMGAFVLSIPEHKLRVVAPDVGGGFGSKIYHYAEEAFVTWASSQIGRPVRWCATRSEAFISDAHGRDHVTTAKLALDTNGMFLALKVDTLANMGAYLSTFAPCIPTWLHATLLAGQYKTPLIYCNVRAIFTNTVPVDAYRGAGRPEATYLLERIIDKAAREMGLDQAEIRRRNLIGADEFPYQTPVALEYDAGNYHATLDKVLQMADYDNFATRRAESAAKGKLRGIGLGCYIEAC
ncbi:MAG: xanthine dehydrogenase family protein, partial [Pseudomonadota bacterium]